jgi:hypothetical protein
MSHFARSWSQPFGPMPHLIITIRCTHFAAGRIVMDLAAAVMLFSIVLYMLQQVEDLVD